MFSLPQFSDFASLFDQTARILKLRFGQGSGVGEEILLPHVLRGEEALSECYRYELDCLSPDAHLELKNLLGLPVEVSVLLSDGGYRLLSGLITEARQLGADGGFAKYGLIIEPALAALRLAAGSRVFQDKTVPEIVAVILDEHIAGNPVFAESFRHRAQLTKEYPRRSYCLQYRESDQAFIQRLLREEGISYRFAFSEEHDTRNRDSEQHDVPTHALILFDDAYSLNAAAQDKVRFHRADGTEGEDTIIQWQSTRRIQSGRSSLASYEYKGVSLNSASEPTASVQGEGGDTLSSSLEAYDPRTVYYGNPGDMARYASLRQQARDLKTKRFTGGGTARALTVGSWFELQDHPIHDQDIQEDRQFLVTELGFEARNNLPDFPSPVSGGGVGGEGKADVRPVYANTFHAVRRSVPLVPDYTPAHAKPTSLGPQTATVVGSPDEEIYTDELGRIKIQFHWQRPQDGHSDLNETSSTWVRVVYPAAGANWGQQYIPRIGQEVLVEFLDGDIDRPIVRAAIHNGTHLPPTFSGAGSLPANKMLSGIKSKEYKGSNYNELLFDDSTGETRTKLSSEHGKTQLNQGYLIPPRTDGKGEPRGEGFELRTDDAGTLRAAKGLLISTDARHNATGKQLDRQEAQAQLDAAINLANTMSDSAEHQLANKTETGKDKQLIDGDKQNGKSAKSGHQQHLKDAIASWEQDSNTDKDGKTGSKDQPGGQPAILLSAPAGIALTTPNAMTISTGTNLDQIAQRDTTQTTGRRWIHNAGESISLFVEGSKAKLKETLKLIAAKGKVQMQAQSDDIDLAAEKSIKLTSISADQLWAGKANITLKAGGAMVKIEGGNIYMHAPGTVSIKAASHSWGGPASLSVAAQQFPASEISFDQELVLFLDNGEPVANRKFALLFEDGAKLQGITDAQGKTGLKQSALTGKYQFRDLGPAGSSGTPS